ncbi:MAG: glycosyltransferase family 4 protein, partial [Deltaproteobacteria bacterium]|nr:glycosyltransferase family 4 protein [Deltaproteobacteria bacterium]
MPDKILIVTRNLPPLVGGMERVVWHIVEGLSKKAIVFVIGPKACKEHLPTNVSCTEIPSYPFPLFLWMAKIAALYHASRFRPKIVFAGSGLTAPLAWLGARMCHARSAVYLHGLDIDIDHPLYNILWKPFIRRSDIVIVNSRFTKRLAINAGVPKKHIFILHPGVTLPDDSRADQLRERFRNRYKLGVKPLMLYIGRITARKGLAHFVDRIFPEIVSTIPDALLMVIGEEPSQSVMKQTGEMLKIEKSLKTHGLQNHVIFLGARPMNDPDISAAYFAADVHVFPVQYRPHDNEGFGMVALEAAAHGLPTVAFFTGGVADAVKDGVSGYLINAGNDEGFSDAVIHTLSFRNNQPLK